MTPAAFLCETPLTFAVAGERVGVSAQTVKRWVRDGIRDVRLEAYKVGGSWRTTTQALARFVAATSPVGVAPATPAARTRADAAADARLTAAGW